MSATSRPSKIVGCSFNDYGGSGRRESANQPRADEQRHLSLVAALGCIACRKLGYFGTPAELHHIRETVGMGQRARSDEVIPLCPAHHRGVRHPHVPSVHLARKAFVVEFGSEIQLLEEVKKLTGEAA